MSLFDMHPKPWRFNEFAQVVDSTGHPISRWLLKEVALVERVNSDSEVPPSTLNHDNHAMLARRVGEMEREVEALRAALRSARLIFDGVGDA